MNCNESCSVAMHDNHQSEESLFKSYQLQRFSQKMRFCRYPFEHFIFYCLVWWMLEWTSSHWQTHDPLLLHTFYVFGIRTITSTNWSPRVTSGRCVTVRMFCGEMVSKSFSDFDVHSGHLMFLHGCLLVKGGSFRKSLQQNRLQQNITLKSCGNLTLSKINFTNLLNNPNFPKLDHPPGPSYRHFTNFHVLIKLLHQVKPRIR